MDAFDALLSVLAATTLVLGLVSGLTRNKVMISEPVIACAAGFIVGPHLLSWVDLESLGEPSTLVEQTARLTIAVAVIGAAIRLPKPYFSGSRLTGVAMTLGPAMVFMWGASTLCAWWLLGLDWWAALLVGAIVTPTDPVLASSIVTGSLAKQAVPARLRLLLTAESGANDGLAYLFVLLPLFCLLHPTGKAFTQWLIEGLLLGVLMSVAVGLLIGFVAGVLIRRSESAHTMEETSLVTAALSLSLFTVGFVKLLGGNEILAVFAAGVVFRDVVTKHDDEENEKFQESAKRFFELPVFVMFGMTLPIKEWEKLGLPLLALVLAILFVRRLPFFILARRLVPQLHSTKDALFVGWFGPIGIAALFYALHAQRHGGPDILWPAVSAVVLASIVVHGLTSTLGARHYRDA